MPNKTQVTVFGTPNAIREIAETFKKNLRLTANEDAVNETRKFAEILEDIENLCSKLTHAGMEKECDMFADLIDAVTEKIQEIKVNEEEEKKDKKKDENDSEDFEEYHKSMASLASTIKSLSKKKKLAR